MSKRLPDPRVLALIGLYLTAIVAANLIVTHYGPSASIVTAAVFIGLDLTTRDRLHDFWARHRLPKMALLILAGSALSYAVNSDAVKIAEASAIAFAAAELTDFSVYSLVHRHEWVIRSNVSNVFSSTVDSVVFVTLAFGFSWQIAFAQACAKIAGGFVWSLALGTVRTRRERAAEARA